jgi:hypothetical protein
MIRRMTGIMPTSGAIAGLAIDVFEGFCCHCPPEAIGFVTGVGVGRVGSGVFTGVARSGAISCTGSSGASNTI